MNRVCASIVRQNETPSDDAQSIHEGADDPYKGVYLLCWIEGDRCDGIKSLTTCES